MNNQKNIVLCGVGGQGTVLASKLLAAAAMSKDIPVMSAETIGMAQRGGSVFSHLRMGNDLYSPMIETGTADLIIGFEPGETVRMLPYLKTGGHVVVSTRAVKPVTEKDFDMGLFSKKNVKEKEGIFLDRKTIFNNLMGTTLPYYIIVAFILYIVSLFVK